MQLQKMFHFIKDMTSKTYSWIPKMFAISDNVREYKNGSRILKMLANESKRMKMENHKQTKDTNRKKKESGKVLEYSKNRNSE